MPTTVFPQTLQYHTKSTKLMILQSVLGQFRKLDMFFNVVLRAESDDVLLFFLFSLLSSLAAIVEKPLHARVTPSDGAAKIVRRGVGDRT